MPGAIINTMDPPPLPPVVESEPVLGFIVSHQKLELEVDFAGHTILGQTEITIIPQQKDLKVLRFNARQCDIPSNGVHVNGRPVHSTLEDGYKKLDIPNYIKWSAEQYELQKERIKPLLQIKPGVGELYIPLPKWVRIEEVNPFSESAQSALKDRAFGAVSARSVSSSAGGVYGAAPPSALTTPKVETDTASRFAPVVVKISFTTKNFRDGLHFVGLEDGDIAYPHVYTRHSTNPGIASCIFPCIDDPAMRCTWEISVKCGRTLGDTLRKQNVSDLVENMHTSKKEHYHGRTYGANSVLSRTSATEQVLSISSEDSLLEMTVVSSGELMDESPDPDDSSKKIVSFLCSNQVAAQHIGFAIGPFEQVDLSEFREEDEDEKLGQKAVQVYGYCLPRRANELRNTCATMAHAVDWLSLTFGSYPFQEYRICFVDEQVSDTVPIASMSLCSTRLLFGEDIIDTEVEVTRQLVHALASQWIGINVVAAARVDSWLVVGISYFITDLFMKQLCGNNEYRFRMKTLADKLVDLDIQRPSLYALGEILHLGSFEFEFMALKAPLVLFILDRRLMKSSGSTGLARIVGKLFYSANTGEQLSDKTVSTDGFRRLCEKIGHYKADSFFNQWVLGAGCPRFLVTQKFNKKRLSVEMTIAQKQDTLPSQRKLEKEAFVREFKEEISGVYAGEAQPFFTGPMTIRIHEADGTPYEHIVEIREATQRIEIPYHTKYKRLKRSRREKERATAGPGADIHADNENDVLLYCLGDVLQSQEEMNEWSLVDWDPELEARMEQESYEWIRMDADFEWICELNINMPSYMFVSQLQQDRDVVAQQDSMLFLGKQASHPHVSSILVRTLMDRRYFHGIREMAAGYLPKHGTETHAWIGRKHLEKAFQEFFCYPGTTMPRPNNFTDKTAYLIQCAIPRAMTKVRNLDGKCPPEARQFILDQLRFNDNSNNEFSDCFHIANLMNALADSLIPVNKGEPGEMSFSFETEDTEELRTFQQQAVDEIDRYRRMDEWILSYQNIYTTTALGCKQRLMKAKVITTESTIFHAYTHDETLDLVRIKAFEGLIDLGFFATDILLKYLLYVMGTDSSTFVRERLFHIFGLGLATIAFGEHKEAEPTAAVEDALIIEQEADMEEKKAKIARTMTIEGALSALKAELEDNLTLKEMLWTVIASPIIGLMEQNDLLDICFFLYESIETMVVVLQYPRYWRVENRGHGCLVFKRTNKVRPKRMLKFIFSGPHQSQPLAPPPASLSVRAVTAGVTKPLKRQSPPNGSDNTSIERPAKIVRVKLESWQLQKFPPGPHIGGRSLTAKPPAQAPPVNPINPANPPSIVPQGVKMRIPLPTAALRTPLPESSASPANLLPIKKPGGIKLKLSFGKQGQP